MDSKRDNKAKGFSEAAKRSIVQEYLDGKWKTLKAASDAHGIRGKSTLSKWIRLFGFGKILDMKGSRHAIMAKITSDTAKDAEIQVLKQELRQTREALAQMTVNSLYHENLFKIGVRELGGNPAALKKKLILELSKQPSTTTEKNRGSKPKKK